MGESSIVIFIPGSAGTHKYSPKIYEKVLRSCAIHYHLFFDLSSCDCFLIGEV